MADRAEVLLNDEEHMDHLIGKAEAVQIGDMDGRAERVQGHVNHEDLDVTATDGHHEQDVAHEEYVPSINDQLHDEFGQHHRVPANKQERSEYNVVRKAIAPLLDYLLRVKARCTREELRFMFHSHDRHDTHRISSHRFARIMVLEGLPCSLLEIRLIAQEFGDDTGTINWMDFIDAAMHFNSADRQPGKARGRRPPSKYTISSPLSGKGAGYKKGDHIKYFIGQCPDDREPTELALACRTWSVICDVTFEVSKTREGADLVFEFGPVEGGFLAFTIVTPPGEPHRITFSDTEEWIPPDKHKIGLKLFEVIGVAVHELGKLLGLPESDDPAAAMYKKYTPSDHHLVTSDIAMAHELMGEKEGLSIDKIGFHIEPVDIVGVGSEMAFVVARTGGRAGHADRNTEGNYRASNVI